MSITDFENDLASNLDEIRSDLVAGNFNFSPLKGTAVPKPGKAKDRLICMPTVRDRVVQKALLFLINRHAFPLINNGVSFCGISENPFSTRSRRIREVKDIRAAILKILENLKEGRFCVLQSDIKGFFDTVPKAEMLEKLNPILPDETFKPLLEDIVNFEIANRDILVRNARLDVPPLSTSIGIPQGSPLSPLFSNIYLLDFDEAMKGRYQSAYIRYADDFLVLCDSIEEAEQARNFATDKLKEFGLTAAEGGKTITADLKEVPILFLGLEIGRSGIFMKNARQLKKAFDDDVLNQRSKRYFDRGKPLDKDHMERRMIATIQGIAEFGKFYHSERAFASIRSAVDGRAMDRAFPFLKKVVLPELKPIIRKSDWEKLFPPVEKK